jgi:hypothetical protein
MIVKVQLSIVTNAEERQMLIYNKDQRYMYEGPATEEIIELLQPKSGEYYFHKAYFKAHVIPDPQPHNSNAIRFVLDKWVSPRNW